MADTAHTTIGSLFSFNGCIIGYVCEETSLIVVLGRQQTCGLMAGTATIGSLFHLTGVNEGTSERRLPDIVAQRTVANLSVSWLVMLLWEVFSHFIHQKNTLNF